MDSQRSKGHSAALDPHRGIIEQLPSRWDVTGSRHRVGTTERLRHLNAHLVQLDLVHVVRGNWLGERVISNNLPLHLASIRLAAENVKVFDGAGKESDRGGLLDFRRRGGCEFGQDASLLFAVNVGNCHFVALVGLLDHRVVGGLGLGDGHIVTCLDS